MHPANVKRLTPRMQAFVDHYLNCWSYTEAAKRAGYGGGYATRGVELSHHPLVVAEIATRLSDTAMTANEVLRRLGEQARASLQPFVRINGEAVEFDFSHPDAAANMHLIKRLKTKRKRIVEGRGDDAETWEHEWVEVELHDAQRALEILAKHHGLFADQQIAQITINVHGIDKLLDMIYGQPDTTQEPDSGQSDRAITDPGA